MLFNDLKWFFSVSPCILKKFALKDIGNSFKTPPVARRNLGTIWSHGQKVIKSSILGSVPSTSGAIARKSTNRTSWDRFRRHLGPWPESHQIEYPGIGSVDIWSHGQKVIKSSILGSVSSSSGAMARKSLNRLSWDRFRRHLEPWPESHRIEHPSFVFGSGGQGCNRAPIEYTNLGDFCLFLVLLKLFETLWGFNYSRMAT